MLLSLPNLYGVLTRELIIETLLTLTTCCADLKDSITTLVDFAPVFTELNDIKTTLTDCCADLAQDIADLDTTLTTCCADIQDNFEGTFTVLADLKDSVTDCWIDLKDSITNINLDLSGVFTELNDIKTTVTDCCINIQNNFEGTFTVLADLKDSLTDCCEDLKDSITNIDLDLSGVFTELNDIKITLTECCADIQDNFEGTFTVLADLKESLTDCCADLKDSITNIDLDLSGVFTELNYIKITLTECCEDLKDSITDCCADLKTTITDCCLDLKDTITECCEDILEAIEDIDRNFCSPTFITATSFGVGVDMTFTITVSGVYKLAEDISFVPSSAIPAIVITSSCVTVDLQCFKLKQANTTAGVNGITVSSSVNDILIVNGQIQDFTNIGISVGDIVSRIEIRDLNVLSAAVRGIEFIGSSGINNGVISDCNILSCGQGASGDAALALDQCTNIKVMRCCLNNNGNASNDFDVIQLVDCTNCSFSEIQANNNVGNNLSVFSLSGVAQNTFVDCSTNGNTGSTDARGFELISSTNNLRNQFINCTSVLLSGTSAVDGFFTGTANNNNYYFDCRVIANTTSGSSSNAVVHGFNFISNSDNQAMNCIATCVNAPSATKTFGAIGFDFNTTSSNSLMNCTSSDHITGDSSSSIGYKVLDGFCNDINNSKVVRTDFGFRLDPAASLKHTFFKNASMCNGIPQDDSYVGFPGGSFQIADDISLINASLSSPWTNIAIGNA